MSDDPSGLPPSYDDVVKASAPPPDAGLGYSMQGSGQAPYPTPGQPPYPAPGQPPYPTSNQPPYPNPQHPPYPVTVQSAYPPYSQPQGYNTAQYPPTSAQPLQPGYGQAQPAMQTAGQFNYSTVTVVNPGTSTHYTHPVTHGQVITSPQMLAQQQNRRRICLCFFTSVSVVIFIIIVLIIVT